VDLRQLRYFVAVVDHGGFRNAARALHVSQPPLSRAVRDLEAELDATLVDRRGAGLPTRAGAVLLRHARKILDAIEAARTEVSASSRSLRVGHVLPEYCSDPSFRSAAESLEGVEVKVTPILPGRVPRALAAGVIDVAFVFLPFEHVGSDLVVEPVGQDALVAAVRSADPLGTARRLTLREMAQQPLILFPRRAMPERYDEILGHFRRAGRVPRLVGVGPHLREALERVARGDGVTLVPERASRVHAIAGVALRPLADLTALWTLAAVRQPENAVAARLLAALRRAR
jgi:LysR family transcriptional regulator, benzoate and cis,cis-muconate-responsive activator of ben and cat genes